MAKKTESTPQRRALILWALLGREGGVAFQAELKPEPTADDRKALEQDGLVRSERQGRYRKVWIEVTEKGWDWAGRNLDAALPANSPAGTEILRAWLMRLARYMAARDVALVEILAPQPAPQPSLHPAPVSGSASPPVLGAPVPPADLRERVRNAYLEATGGRFNTRALLRDIRARLADIDRAVLDDALKAMQRDQEAALYPLDNRVEITDADREAAIAFGTEARHILWIAR